MNAKHIHTAALRALIPLLLIALPACSQADATPRDLTAVEWREDLAYLAKKLPARHENAFHQVSEADFRAAVQDLDARIPELEGHQILVELGRIAALVGDGHTELWLTQAPTGFGRLPVALYYFGDDLYIVAAAEGHTGLIGSRVVAFGGVPAAEAYDRVIPLIGRDNEFEYLRSAPRYLVVPEILHALGMAQSPDAAQLTLAGPDGDVDITLRPLAATDVRWTNARQLAGEDPPIGARNPDRWYWFEYLEDSKTLFLQYDSCNNQRGEESIKRFAAKLFEFVDSHPIERFIVDLRYNTGGNFHKNAPLIEGIRKRPAINQKEKLFVMTSRTTFSAAMVAAIDLKRGTHAILVGEPSRGKPNHYSDNEPFNLPNSGVMVEYSKLYREAMPELGDAPYLPVDLEVAPTFEDYRAGHDAVLAAILTYDAERGE